MSITHNGISGVITVAALVSAAGVAGLTNAIAQPVGNVLVQQKPCPSVSREAVEDEIRKGLSTDEITAMYGACLPDGVEGVSLKMQKAMTVGDDGFVIGGPIIIDPNIPDPTQDFDVYYEEIDSCGYHPQRRELECAVRVKQRFGFAGTPTFFGTAGSGPGSFEWIRFCVDGLPVSHVSAVHVHDEAYGDQPDWHYGVAVQADARLHQRLLDGTTHKARAILSWQVVPPQACNWIPRWGNWFDFQVKLDP